MTKPASRRRLISEASALIEDWTGFTLRQTAPRRIAETFDNRAARLGYDNPMAYLDALRDLEPTADEPQRLVNLITNGLTAFWRDEPQLSALRSLLDHLQPPSGATEPIYVWCAGVSTGEEAHTVAMIADEESVPVEVLGTDVNTEFLETARRGVYSDWSLRRLAPRRRREYLEAVDDGHWKVAHRCFDDVRFAHHNVLAPPPRSNHPDGRWDIVLCRNVLIYFSKEATTRALRHLTDGLNQDGYLMFGSSEQIHPERLGDDAPALRSIRQGGGFLYRPGRQRTGQTIEPGSWTVEDGTDAPGDEPDLPAVPTGDAHGLSNLEETTSDVTEAETITDLVTTAGDHIDAGEHELALACLEAALGYDPFHVEAHCLMGTVLHSLGATEEAAEAFQKALFLEPSHWFAAHRSAMIYEQRGDADSARRAHRRTLDGLDEPDPLDQTLVLGDLVESRSRSRQMARQSAREFFRLHGTEN